MTLSNDEPAIAEKQDNEASNAVLAKYPGAHPSSAFFAGTDGLRAGWGILLFLLFREAFSYCIYPLERMLFTLRSMADGFVVPSSMYGYEGAGLICLVGATSLMAWVEQRPVSAYGFRPERRWRDFFSGAAWGLALLSLLVGLLRAAGYLVFDGRLLSAGQAVGYGLVWLGGFLLVALVEEMYTRAYLQFTLTRGLCSIYRKLGAQRAGVLGFWSAAAILSFAFGFGHRFNPGESRLGMVNACLVGLLFCLSLWRTGSLWWAIGFHAAWDWAQSFLFGVADSGLMVQGHFSWSHPIGRAIFSGGLTGPEGSILMFLVLVLGLAAVVFTLPQTAHPYLPEPATEVAIALDSR